MTRAWCSNSHKSMNVTVYSTPTCPYCDMAKKYLDDNNIAYESYDVSADQAKAEEMVQKSGQMGVPVIVVEKDGSEEVVVGFDQARLQGLLGL